MPPRTCLSGVLILAAALWCGLSRADEPQPPTKAARAWTLDEARQQMALNPDDAYLQYVALQLARNEKKQDEVTAQIQDLHRRWGWEPEHRVDLFGLFTGALAVQESLQLDTMRGQVDQAVAAAREPAARKVKLSELNGPSEKSHPWEKMLGDKQPAVDPLALCVPADQYYLGFRSLGKFLEASDAGDLWGAHLMNQAARTAKSPLVSQRLKQQLAVATDPLTRPFYDMVVQEVAITGSDLYFREGSDVTVLFAVKQPEVFRLRMDGFLDAARKSRPDAVQSTGTIEGVAYTAVTTPDRAIHAFSAYPKPTLHVRSNSKAALERVLAAIAGKPAATRLGETAEFRYIRTLMPRGDKEEDGFVYLSDPFIHRLVGPELKLTERRRMLCYNHLRMIGHASLLYRTQYGKPAESLEQLATAGCAPAVFGQEKYFCPEGGRYTLSSDGRTGVCSLHGHADQLVPCRETPVVRVTEAEAKEYREFVAEYSQYWRTYFDPIALRIQLAPEQYRVETIILPLIDNSVYSGMKMAVGGRAEPLDSLPVPKRNIFTLALHWDKESLLRQFPVFGIVRQFTYRPGNERLKEPNAQAFLTRGIGDRISMNIYDASPMFDFNLADFLGDMLGRFRGASGGGMSDEVLPLSFLVASLNSPVYMAVPVIDAKVVDQFLDDMDTQLAALARQPESLGWWNARFDCYKVPLTKSDARIRCYTIGLGPVKWRMFLARLDRGLYLASKEFILEDLAALKGKTGDGGPTAHAMVRIRPENWNEVLPDYRLGWEESSRRGCLDNLGPLASVARSMGPLAKGEEIVRHADAVHAVHFFCPDGGRYDLLPDGRTMACSIHGTTLSPKQPPGPDADSSIGRLLKEFHGATAELTFLEDGLHAVLTVRRK